MRRNRDRDEVVTIFAEPIDPNAKRAPWHRWIRNNYRANRGMTFGRFQSAYWACRNWLTTL